MNHDVFEYDFHLLPQSRARGIASDSYLLQLPVDLDGVSRGDEAVDAGCFRFVEQE